MSSNHQKSPHSRHHGSLRNWCPLRESDPRPLPYQGSALPLSQKGKGLFAQTLKSLPNHSDIKTMERGRRIELLALAWKAKVLPLYEPREGSTQQTSVNSITGGEGWIRTSVLVRGQIYSLLPLTTRPPLLGEPRIMPAFYAACHLPRSFLCIAPK